MSSKHLLAAVVAIGIAAGVQHSAAGAGGNGVIRYGATTTNMQPAGLDLRFDILRWSDEAARAAVVKALESEDVHDALDDLPTVGYVWPDGSPVGYAVKYADDGTSDSGERLTLVTSRPLGSYDFGGWKVDGSGANGDLAYTVIELDVADGNASGTASLAAAVDIDAAAGTITLTRTAATPVLFDNVRRLDLPHH